MFFERLRTMMAESEYWNYISIISFKKPQKQLTAPPCNDPLNFILIIPSSQ